MAYALNSLSMIPIMQGSGLVFKDLFPAIGITATQGSTIISTNMAFGMLIGLMNGPLLRHFGWRKVAIAASLLYSISITLTTFSTTFTLIMITYGILASVGMTLSMSAFSLALNTYFTTKRGRATGLAITVTALGSIIIPPVTTFLLDYYGPQGTILLFGSHTLHSIIGALLLHPVKWHMKKQPNVENIDKETNMENSEKERLCDLPSESSEEDEDAFDDVPMIEEIQSRRRLTISSIDHDIEIASIYGFETPLSRQLSETARTISQEMSIDGWTWINSHESSNHIRPRTNYHWWSSGKSIDSINLGSSINIFENGSANQSLSKSAASFVGKNKALKKSCRSILENDTAQINNQKANSTKVEDQNGDIREKSKKKSRIVRILRWLVTFYDLNLLRDPIYVNIMLGMSIAIFAEINFSLLTPFILADRGLSTNQIATTMSIIASVDLIFRSIAPYLGEWLDRTPRTMYLISLIFLVVSRTGLIFTRTFKSVIIVAGGLGIAKGIRSVYMSLVIPSYVPIHRLPYASAIQMVVNGLIMISAGPCLGVIRDAMGSYTPCIVIINCTTTVTIALWLIELIIVQRTRKRKSKQAEQEFIEQN